MNFTRLPANSLKTSETLRICVVHHMADNMSTALHIKWDLFVYKNGLHAPEFRPLLHTS